MTCIMAMEVASKWRKAVIRDLDEIMCTTIIDENHELVVGDSTIHAKSLRRRHPR